MNTHPLIILTHTVPADWIVGLNGRCELLVGPSTEHNSKLDEAQLQLLFESLVAPIYWVTDPPPSGDTHPQ